MPGGGTGGGSGGGGVGGAGSGPSKPKFSDNEKVLCYHGPLLYEAKCVRSRADKSGSAGEFQYYVHYQGWNKNWDEWVGENRILKANAENLERKERLLAQHQASVKEGKKKGGGGAGGGGRGPGPGATDAPPDSVPGSSSSSSKKSSDSANTSRASTPVSEPPSGGL